MNDGLMRLGGQSADTLFSRSPGDMRAEREGPNVPTDPIRAARARGSAIWAAYGDALGFISELTDAEGLRRRTGGAPLREPVSWMRRVGGRSGVGVLLPAGCYSDDTQLRLATARAVGPGGFDVEAFSKVELPSWLAYELGGGRSTKAAAANLAKPTVSWFANAFKGWIDSGGDGAAMRIQPHVWAAPRLDRPASYLVDVVRNAVCTHHHPTAVMGAVLHSLALGYAMHTGDLPPVAVLGDLIQEAGAVPSLLNEDPELGSLWLGAWERGVGKSFAKLWGQAQTQARDALAIAAKVSNGGERGYHELLHELDLFNPKSRGSGLLTALCAVAVTWREDRPAEAMAMVANAVGSDTDTIATMAGAVLGAVVDEEPPVPVLDQALIRAEANRLTGIASGSLESRHQYPDLLTWTPPRTQADSLVMSSQTLLVPGLGVVSRTLGDPVPDASGGFAWQWVELDYGQTLLIKRRAQLPELPDLAPVTGQTDRPTVGASPGGHVTTRTEPRPTRRTETSGHKPELDLEKVLAFLEKERMSHHAVGYAMRRVAREGSTDQVATFLAVLLERLRR